MVRAPDTPRAEHPGRAWRLDAGIVLGAGVFLFLLHPAPGVFWFDHPWIAYNLLPLPLSPAGAAEAIRWQATVHSPQLARPARALQWWLAGKALGCAPLAYHVFNLITLTVVVGSAARVAREITGHGARGVVVGACLAVSYATAFSVLFFGYGQPAALAFIGFAAYFRAERTEGTGRRAVQAAAILFILVAALSHETYLVYALLPLAHAAIVRRRRAVVLRALPFLAILPAYAVARQLQASALGTAPSWLVTMRAALRESPGILLENPGRVAFATLTGGLPLDPLRVLPYFSEFARIRELVLSPAGLVTLAVVVAPTLGLSVFALKASREDAAARRRLCFCLVWLALGTVPLMLPVGTPEAVHLTGALPALFMLWTEGLTSARSGRRSGLLALPAVMLLLWSGVHVGAHWVLFQRDVPMMARSVEALHRVLLRAQEEGVQARVLFFPAQIGGHYGMLPTVPALYRTAAGGCVRGDRPAGCLIEPTWIWSTLRPWPPLASACRTGDGVRVGPLTPEIERELEGSRRMLAHPTTTLMEQSDPRLLGACPLDRSELLRVDGATYLVYRLPPVSGARWYRFTLEPQPALVAVSECDGRPR